MTGLPLVRRERGIELAVKVTPRAARAVVDGVVLDASGGAWLAVRVTAPPDSGRANAALCRLLATALGVPPSSVALLAGAAARWKRVGVQGDPEELAARVAQLLGPDGAAPR